MPDDPVQAADPAPASPAPAAADPAQSGLPAQVRQFLADNPDPPAPGAPAAAAADPAPAEPTVADAPVKDVPPAGDGKPAITAEDIAAAVQSGQLSIDDIARVPGVDGKVGQLAQRLVQKQQADANAAALKAQKVEVARSDPDHPLSQIVLGEASQEDQQAATDQVANQVLTQQVGGLGVWLSDKMSPAALKQYADTVLMEHGPGKPQLTVPALFEATYQIRHADELATERAKWEKEARPAIEKEIRAQIAEGEPDVQVNANSPAGSGTRTLTTKQIDVMDWREYEKLQPDILAGRIKLVAA